MLFDTQLASISTLKARVLTFPKELHSARLRALDAEQRVKALKAEVADAEMEELLIASMKINGDGKKVYPNDEARKAAVSKALAESPTHRDRVKRLTDAETEMLNAKLDVGRIEDEHRAYRAVVDLTAAEVQLLVHGV